MPALAALVGLRGIAIGVAVLLLLSGGLYVRHVIKENAELTSQIAVAKAQQVEKELELSAIKASAEADRLRAANTAKLHQDIENAPASDDAPIAPVLRNALIGLHTTPTR